MIYGIKNIHFALFGNLDLRAYLPYDGSPYNVRSFNTPRLIFCGLGITPLTSLLGSMHHLTVGCWVENGIYVWCRVFHGDLLDEACPYLE